jgi:heme/copper-type cytochrome/quinol oxidase subunit 2
LLEVDNKLVVPVGVNIRMIVTATDVLHSWSVPSLGVKIDAVPGRLNQTSFTSILKGKFYGQCSEIFGANHAFMPICIQAVSLSDYISWVKSRI